MPFSGGRKPRGGWEENMTVASMTADRRFFPGIQALRAVAATLVVIEHSAYVANDYPLLESISIIPHFYYGRIGVILFFAISGFVIALQRRKPVGEFIAHRLLRIYPSYWIALALEAFCFAVLGRSISATAASLLLYPSASDSSLTTIPYWTLAFEMTFYALAAVAFWGRLSDRTLTIIAIVWIAAVNLFPGNVGAYAFPGPMIFLSPAVQVFPMGLICGIHFEALRRFGRWPYALLTIAAYVASFPFAELSVPKLLTLGISASCLVLAVADLGQSRIVKWLGDASYGIYLVHFPVIVAVSSIAPLRFPWLLVIGMICGTLFGRFDHWLYEWLKAKTSLRRGRNLRQGEVIDRR
jgi:exopolysaccharide production protein ExoZ